MILACRLVSVRHVAIGIAISFALLFCAADGAAQASRVGATLEGIVRDTSGAVIPSSKVTLHNPLTNQSRTVTTDEQGFFRAEQLAVGTYEIRVEQTGFAPYRQAGVGASLGQTVHLASGHAAATFAFARVLASEYPSKRVQLAAYALALAVSASRVTARQHFPSDVLVGGTFGYLIGGYVVRHRAAENVGSGFSFVPAVDVATHTFGANIALRPDQFDVAKVGRFVNRMRRK